MHTNLPPFVARRMIQHLVTSNPSPTYGTNVANAFKNGTFTSNGLTFGVAGDRGNMQAFVAAVLLDPEARLRDPSTPENPPFRHLLEPVPLLPNVIRTLHRTIDDRHIIFY